MVSTTKEKFQEYKKDMKYLTQTNPGDYTDIQELRNDIAILKKNLLGLEIKLSTKTESTFDNEKDFILWKKKALLARSYIVEAIDNFKERLGELKEGTSRKLLDNAYHALAMIDDDRYKPLMSEISEFLER